jgi:hypothetical protein
MRRYEAVLQVSNDTIRSWMIDTSSITKPLLEGKGARDGTSWCFVLRITAQVIVRFLSFTELAEHLLYSHRAYVKRRVLELAASKVAASAMSFDSDNCHWVPVIQALVRVSDALSDVILDLAMFPPAARGPGGLVVEVPPTIDWAAVIALHRSMQTVLETPVAIIELAGIQNSCYGGMEMLHWLMHCPPALAESLRDDFDVPRLGDSSPSAHTATVTASLSLSGSAGSECSATPSRSPSQPDSADSECKQPESLQPECQCK